jgi:hypothetical protein
MATTTYSFGPASVDTVMNVATFGNQLHPSIASNAAGTRYFGAWTTDGAEDLGSEVRGRLMDHTGAPATGEVSVNPPAPFNQGGVSLALAGLAGGGFVAAYADYGASGGNIYARLLTANGSPADTLAVQAGPTSESHPGVAGLADGGFAVSWTKSSGGNNDDTYMSIYNADGSLRHASGAVSIDPAGTSRHSSIAGLAGGGLVVAWQESPTAGGGSTDARFRRFDAVGTALDGTDNAGVLIDSNTSPLQNIQVAALPDGGFVAAYTDSGWGFGDDITARIFNADGTARSAFLHVNGAANDGFTGGQQVASTLTVLPNGYIIVGWASSSNQWVQAYDTAGNALGQNTLVASNAFQGEIAALSGSVIARVWTGGSSSIHTALQEFGRGITGDGGDETITGVGDGIWEVISGAGGDDVLEGKDGHDTLQGGAGFDHASYSTAPSGVAASLVNPAGNTGDAADDSYDSIEGLIGSSFDDTLVGDALVNTLQGGEGNDTLTGGLGQDKLIGGAGDDTAVFSQSLGQYTVQDFGAKILVAGPDGTDTLTSVEHLRFTDTTLNVVDDGNALFDTLYYFSRNADVYFSGVNALDHFNAIGSHEGRDPNGFFDTSGYLAVNPDVAASGVSPLEHYHHTGWKQGRDPGASFDTTLYLIHNPDVAAAGIDPLAHFLANGFSEGRSAYAAVGSVASGFDAQYYLFHNPDVAAAGIDPAFHFNVVGWTEGRDPNAWFDSAGYLSHYTDVAAAGLNPLQHYEAVGWIEGRDPSTRFDTAGYLAANPDVAAANYNPLDHFLQHGIYEGRAAVNDGLWH